MSTIGAYFRLARAGWIMVREGVIAAAPGEHLEGLPRLGWQVARLLARRRVRERDRSERMSRALNRLGPSYVKLGQFMATRPDVVGREIALDLAHLQDRMDFFSGAAARKAVETSLGRAVEDVFSRFDPPIAAASIAQVHPAEIDDVNGLRPGLDARGYALTNPGSFQNLTDDFSAQINAFKQANVEIVTGVPIPPDFTTFWNQAKQQGFTPKAASIGKAILFPQAVEALGDAGNNLSSEVWWSPSHPFKSSLNGLTAGEVAAAYSEATGKQWTQPIGFVHALFELATDVMGRVSDAGDSDAVAEAIAASKLDTVVGPIAFDGKGLPPFAAKNVCKTPLVGGQWRLKDGGGYDLVIVDNTDQPSIPTGGTMQPIV